jgi:hypothetical protein
VLAQTICGYPVATSNVIGEPVHLVGSELVAVGGLVGSLNLGVSGALAHMASARGEWILRRRRRFGWDFLIERGGGELVGWYQGRRLMAGGTISLIDGIQADLRRDWAGSPLFGWKLESTDTGRRYAEIHCPGRLSKRSLTLTLRTLPDTVFADVVVLTSCAVLRLQQLAANQAALMSGAQGGC